MKFRLILSLPLFCLIQMSCRKPLGFEYRQVQNIHMQSVGFDKTALFLNLVLYNPNHFGVNLKNANATVFMDAKPLGVFQLDTLMHIGKLAEFSIPVKIEIDVKSVMQNAMSAFLRNEVSVRVTGTSRVGSSGFYVNVPFDYTQKMQLSEFIKM